MKFMFLVFVVVTSGVSLAWANRPCSDQKGGWRTACLQDRAQQGDESANRTYLDLQNKIKTLTNVSPAYNEQLRKLLKRNELDFITYAESYCDMQNVIAVEDTELNKILSCQIKTQELREEELKGIIETISTREEAK